MYDVIIIGGGIVGLATGAALKQRYPDMHLAVLDKEGHWAAHQSGHNSGVIHSGIYYKPGSLKARFARQGNHSLVAFCELHGIPFDICGKVIVATRSSELSRLEALYQRGVENGLQVYRLNAQEVREREPHVHALAGVFVPSTGIVDYRQVCFKLAEVLQAKGVSMHLNTRADAIISTPQGQLINTTQGTFLTRFLVNCAGLHSDRLANLEGVSVGARIVPFRGEYYELKPSKRHLVKHLIYPVPNPDFPFLGVHFTRMIDGSIHAGPNAVLSLKREGYNKRDIDLWDTSSVMSYAGFWRLAAKHARDGAMEMIRSWNKQFFVRSLQQIIPELSVDDVVPTHAGVRAQALTPSGKLVDDFLLVRTERSLHVCNAPSPAATASLEIAKAIVQEVPAPPTRTLVQAA